MTIKIRPAIPSEKEAWLPLWNGYLTFYECSLPGDITNLTWQRFHDSDEPVYLLAAYEDDRMVGFATYILHRSTWAEQYYCYLEDLFVDSSQRGKGIARTLIEAVASAAKEIGATRLYWSTREGNHTAQALYNKIAEKTDFIQYRALL